MTHANASQELAGILDSVLGSDPSSTGLCSHSGSDGQSTAGTKGLPAAWGENELPLSVMRLSVKVAAIPSLLSLSMKGTYELCCMELCFLSPALQSNFSTVVTQPLKQFENRSSANLISIPEDPGSELINIVTAELCLVSLPATSTAPWPHHERQWVCCLGCKIWHNLWSTEVGGAHQVRAGGSCLAAQATTETDWKWQSRRAEKWVVLVRT